jgi:hypothetical protein
MKSSRVRPLTHIMAQVICKHAPETSYERRNSSYTVDNSAPSYSTPIDIQGHPNLF